MSYGKHFEAMYTGSMVGSGPEVFAVWGYCIATAKPPGEVELNPKLIGPILGMPVQAVIETIKKLGEPDPDSRTKDYDGRRLVPIGQFLYRMPSWGKWNALRNEIERREANREAAKRYRNKRDATRNGVSNDALTHADGNDASSKSAHADADADADAMDGWMDGASRTGNQNGEGRSTPVPQAPNPDRAAAIAAMTAKIAAAKSAARGAGL